MTRQALLVGGIGRMEPLYRKAAESLGYELVYCETSIGRTANARSVAVVVIIATHVSHPLRAKAEIIAAAAKARVIYLYAASLSQVRRALSPEARP